jgi:tetraacyldisaccharide 4'-kinase
MKLPLLVRLLLWPFSILYGGLTQIRAWLYTKGILKQKRLNRPVISVGNLTVGGTGKTPMVIWLAEHLLAQGKRVAILSRGYKGSGGTSDEIELMKFRLQGRAEFGVGPDRYEQGKKLQSNVDLFLLDDGFQHLQLARDANILLLDATQPLGKQTMLPTGRLREPMAAMFRADLLIFTRVETVPGTAVSLEPFQEHPVFSASTQLLGFRCATSDRAILSKDEIGLGPFYAFCGIGNPRAFFQDLKNWKFTLADQCEFPDHHRYDARDVKEIEAAAVTAGAKALVTTEKDAQNLFGKKFERLPVYYAVINLLIPKEDALLSLIDQKVAAAKMVA